MGVSDSILFPWYIDFVQKNVRQINGLTGFFGFPNKNVVCQFVEQEYNVVGKLYDVQHGNWDLNEDDWKVDEKFDLILCLRTAYFAKDPVKLLQKFSAILNTGGNLIIDWGLGSAHFHRDNSTWTFGWEYNGTRCYGEYKGKRYYLWSTFWDDSILSSSGGRQLINFASHQSVYVGVRNWGEQISKEFKDIELLTKDKICKLLKIVNLEYLNTAEQGGIQAFYSVFLLEK